MKNTPKNTLICLSVLLSVNMLGMNPPKKKMKLKKKYSKKQTAKNTWLIKKLTRDFITQKKRIKKLICCSRRDKKELIKKLMCNSYKKTELIKNLMLRLTYNHPKKYSKKKKKKQKRIKKMTHKELIQKFKNNFSKKTKLIKHLIRNFPKKVKLTQKLAYDCHDNTKAFDYFHKTCLENKKYGYNYFCIKEKLNKYSLYGPTHFFVSPNKKYLISFYGIINPLYLLENKISLIDCKKFLSKLIYFIDKKFSRHKLLNNKTKAKTILTKNYLPICMWNFKVYNLKTYKKRLEINQLYMVYDKKNPIKRCQITVLNAHNKVKKTTKITDQTNIYEFTPNILVFSPDGAHMVILDKLINLENYTQLTIMKPPIEFYKKKINSKKKIKLGVIYFTEFSKKGDVLAVYYEMQKKLVLFDVKKFTPMKKITKKLKEYPIYDYKFIYDKDTLKMQLTLENSELQIIIIKKSIFRNNLNKLRKPNKGNNPKIRPDVSVVCKYY
ncbi:hypothetical protein ACFLYU_01350 [Candidatus Dependentiae bacterium]